MTHNANSGYHTEHIGTANCNEDTPPYKEQKNKDE